MVVLKAIGRFFARIGRWIRDTAWVQPLLIVGGIFAIIFSIPYLTNWVKSWFSEGDAATAYYEKNELSWKGVEDSKSGVDRLFKYLENYNTASEADKKKFGDKFFINFVQDGCEGCKSNYEGYKVLQNNWGSSEFKFESGKEEKLKMFNIFIDECNDDDKEYFLEYISGDKSTCRYSDFFFEASQLKNHYMYNVNGGENYYETVFGSEDAFQSPITILIDFTFEGDEGYEIGDMGATEIFYTIAGKDGANGSDSAWAKARSIWDCWNHTGNFSANPDKN